MSFFNELKRRNVFKVGIAYAVSAWILVQVADVLFENIGTPAWVMQTLLVLLGIGFFVAVFFAWAFEMTPEGVKRESEVSREASIATQTGKKLNHAILVLMALAIGYLLYDKFSAPEPASTPVVDTAANSTRPDAAPAAEPGISRQSIAVLPFDNRSPDPNDAFFTEGIHDDLLTNLARIGALKVISRTSVLQYKDTEKTIPVIAEELGVAHVMEGAVQRSGNQVRINVQLIDAQTDEHLWAEIFDRELTAQNLFAIQSDISKRIAEALKATLSPEERQRISTVQTANLDAYDAYLRGRQLMATRKVADLERATQEFQRAVELDPNFALAWVGVADSHYLWTQYASRSYAETIEIREKAIEKALAINPGLGEAYTSLASVHQFYERRDEAEQAFRKSIELSPNYATAYQWYSGHLRSDPLRSKETLQLAHRAVELDPRSMIIGVNLAAEYRTQGLFSRAEQQNLKLIELYPDAPNAHHQLVDMYMWETGEFTKAMKHARKLGEIDPDSFDAVRHQAEIYLAVGDYEAALALQEKIAEMDPDHWWAGWIDLQIAELNGNAAAIQEAINWLQPRVTGQRWELGDLADSYLAAGDIDKARDLYLQALPGLLEPGEWRRLTGQDPFRSCLFSWVLMNTGDPELGQALLEEATAYLERDLPAAVEHADRYQPDTCYVTAGETEKALAVLETQLAHGHYYYWMFDHRLPMYEPLRGEPRYRELLAERDRKLDVQRELIAQLDAETGP